MERYVTYITTYKGKLLPKYYIGSTSERRILSGEYYGSIRSKKWKDIFYKELKENRHLFDVEIINYYDNRNDALSAELKIQKEKNVVKSDDYINESFATINGFFDSSNRGKTHPSYGKKMSEESRKKMSDAKKGKTYEEIYGKEKSDIKKKKMSESMKGKKTGGYKKGTRIGINAVAYGLKHTEETKKKISISSSKTHKGKILSEETKNKLSEKNTGINNPRYKSNIENSKILNLFDSGKTVNEIADILLISKDTVINRFKKERGITPSKYTKI